MAVRKEAATQPTILLWNDDYRMVPDDLPAHPVPYRVTRDRGRLIEARAVVFHVPTLTHDITRLPKRPGQVWVAHSMESDVNYPELQDPGFMAAFDLTMTYRRDADVWVPYLPPTEFDPVGYHPAHPDAPATGPRVRDDRPDAPVVYVASNPAAASRRDEYAAELMRHIAVDAYGAALRNRQWDEDRGRVTKNATYARYPFTLAFENSITDDYVTEKFFDPLLVGSVPVYLGAPNVADLAPAPDSYIDVTDFSGPEDLAAHLHELVRDPVAYARLHSWRAEGARPEYRALFATAAVDPLTRLTRLISR